MLPFYKLCSSVNVELLKTVPFGKGGRDPTGATVARRDCELKSRAW